MGDSPSMWESIWNQLLLVKVEPCSLYGLWMWITFVRINYSGADWEQLWTKLFWCLQQSKAAQPRSSDSPSFSGQPLKVRPAPLPPPPPRPLLVQRIQSSRLNWTTHTHKRRKKEKWFTKTHKKLLITLKRIVFNSSHCVEETDKQEHHKCIRLTQG